MNKMIKLSLIVQIIILQSCQTYPPIQTVDTVDLERFMGTWYVIANIPTFLEKDAFNAVESYHLDKDGTILTTFTYNKGGFDGPVKTYTPKGFIRDKQSNAVWAMQFIWPIKMEYRIVYLAPDYSKTVIGRTKRDYLWIMARTPTIAETDFESLMQYIEKLGYDISKVQRVPQHIGNKE
jgi:apolipoprotein D and lipocalin family protein